MGPEGPMGPQGPAGTSGEIRAYAQLVFYDACLEDDSFISYYPYFGYGDEIQLQSDETTIKPVSYTHLSAPSRSRLLTTLVTIFSLPGIGVAEMMIKSPCPTRTFRWLPPDIRESALIGSP